MQEKHAGTLSDGATLIKLADRISNLRSVTSEPPRWWSAQRQIDYFEWSHRVFINLRKLNTPLELLFQKEYNEGLLIVLQRRDHEHSMTSIIAGVRMKILAKLLRLTRYGPH